jgi:hypothetical protein
MAQLLCSASFGIIRIMSIRYQLISFGAAVLLSGCSSSNSDLCAVASQSPVTKETLAGGDYLLELHKQGRLPGDSKDMHGKIESDSATLAREVIYPCTRTFHVTITGESFTNYYTVTRTSKDSGWQLDKAWRTDSAGHTVEEWTVK